MAKTTYAGYLTVPGAATDPIVGSPNTGIGGDIVANFKAIGDVIQKKDVYGGVNVGSTYSYYNYISQGGACVSCQNSTAGGFRTVMLGALCASSNVNYSVNTMENQGSYVVGVTGWKGLSNGNVGYGYSSQSLGIEIPSTGYAILEVDAIFIDSLGVRSNARYRVVVDYSSYPEVLSTTLLQGTDAYASSRFSVSNGTIYLENPDSKTHFVMNIHYTLLQSATTSFSSYNSYNSYTGS